MKPSGTDQHPLLETPTFQYSTEGPQSRECLPRHSPSWWQKARHAATTVVSNLILDSDESNESDDARKSSTEHVPRPDNTYAPRMHPRSPIRPMTREIRERDYAAARSLLPQGWIREVAEKTKTTNPVRKAPSLSGDPDRRPEGSSPPKESRVVKRSYAFYCTPLGMVAGTLSLSEKVITFEPDKRCPEVKAHGLGEFQVVIPIGEVSESAAVILPRTRAIENLFNLPAELHDPAPKWLSETAKRDILPNANPEDDPEPAIGLLQILLKPQKRAPRSEVRRKRSKYASPSTEQQGSSGDTRSPPTLDFTWLAGPPGDVVTPTSDYRVDSFDDSRHNESTTSSQYTAQRRRSAAKLMEISGNRAAPRHESGDSTRKNQRFKRPSKSFVLFRLSSTRSVKEFTRILLDIIDEYNSAITEGSDKATSAEFPPSNLTDKLVRPVHSESIEMLRSNEVGTHWGAYVPHISNSSLDLLMTMCLDHPPPPSAPPGRHRAASDIGHSPTSQSASAMTAESHSLSLQGTAGAWLLRPSPPKLDNLNGATPIFNEDMSLQLSAALPPTVALRRWQLLFDTNLHGVSMKTFFQRCEGHWPALLVLRDEHNTCFGGYSPDGFRESHHYYGTGETFVFTYTPRKTPEAEGELQIFGWSGKNEFFVYSDHERLMFGGGGSFAVAIAAGLLHGHSGPCSTFSNTRLSATEDFRIGDLQVRCVHSAETPDLLT
eukprot:Blabericola_migrator_1__2960@NODE_1855_length_3657_cov_58_127577_g1186_i0_p1_GENE_NODE_1855_length_3657_cov_58_127577_g1186_i0NODE_1855_length_3657_cov_58_127577_g1186_i0_p1_ORF_typecomplete_len717_score93_10TLD/PF07534_16/3_4e34_NODE_1855_length_3657_cov_58_127577_g1186_i03272477